MINKSHKLYICLPSSKFYPLLREFGLPIVTNSDNPNSHVYVVSALVASDRC